MKIINLIIKVIDKFDEFIKKRPKGTMITVLIIVICSGLLTICRNYWDENKTYDSINSSINSSIRFLKNNKKNQSVTIFLDKTGCPECQKVEKEIVPAIKYARFTGKQIIVLDVGKMDHNQIQWMKKHFKGALLNREYLTMPSVFEVSYNISKHQWDVNACENEGNLKKMLQIILK